MTKVEERGGARIYRFPKGGRAGLDASDARRSAAKVARQAPVVEHGAWYHEAALRSERP